MADNSSPADLKRDLLKRAAKLLDVMDLARRLNVPSTLLETWMRGEAASISWSEAPPAAANSRTMTWASATP
jgi:hypothetical protein